MSEGGGLFPVFLTAFQILLGTRARQEDFVIGSPMGFRRRRETENLIGPFVNILLLRADLSGDPPLRSLLARSRRHLVETYTQSDLPLDRVIDVTPFLQVGLNLLDFPPEANEASELTATPLGLDADHSPFELSLILIHTVSSFQACLLVAVCLCLRRPRKSAL